MLLQGPQIQQQICQTMYLGLMICGVWSLKPHTHEQQGLPLQATSYEEDPMQVQQSLMPV